MRRQRVVPCLSEQLKPGTHHELMVHAGREWPGTFEGDSPMTRQTAGTMGVCLLVAAMSAACGSGSAGSSVAPSSVAASTAGASASTGVVTTTGDRSTRTPAQPPADAQSLRGEGVISRVDESSACPALTFEIDGDAFKVSHDTRYDNGRCEDLQVGARVAWAGVKRAHDTAVLVQRLKFAPLSR